MKKSKFFLLPICVLLLGACQANTPAKESESKPAEASSPAQETSSVHEHSFPTEWTHEKEPTCTEDGLDVKVCSCGERQTYVVEKLGHDWDAGTMTTRPTQDADGVMTFKCKRANCTATKTEPIAKITGYAVTFVPGEHCEVLIYKTKQYDTETPTKTNSCFARDEDGNVVEYDAADTLPQPQVNFKVVCDEGYTVGKDNIAVTGTYKNLKEGPDSKEGLPEGFFRITKVQTNLTVTITPIEDTGDQVNGYEATFVKTHCSVIVHIGTPTDDTGLVDEGPQFYSRSDVAPFDYTKNKGRINFEVVPEDGYKFESGIEIGSGLQGAPFVAGKFKQVKRHAENRFEITAIEANIAIKLRCIPVDGEDDLGYTVTFATQHCKVLAYDVKDYSFAPYELVDNKALSRIDNGDAAKYVAKDEEHGIAEVKPQVNFKVVCDEGYVVALENISISGTKGEDWNKLESPQEGIFKITKIKADITVTITAVLAAE